jgi:hypothetical protein
MNAASTPYPPGRAFTAHAAALQRIIAAARAP